MFSESGKTVKINVWGFKIMKPKNPATDKLDKTFFSYELETLTVVHLHSTTCCSIVSQKKINWYKKYCYFFTVYFAASSEM